MPCPTCQHTMADLGKHAGTRRFWCPRCGTVRAGTGASKDYDSPTALRVLLNVCRHLVGAYDDAQALGKPAALSGQVIDRAREALKMFGPPEPGAPPVQVICRDCGLVSVVPDVFQSGMPVSGECPGCGERLFFGK
jgi:transposase-like protein